MYVTLLIERWQCLGDAVCLFLNVHACKASTTLYIRGAISIGLFRKATDPQVYMSIVVEALPVHRLSYPGLKPYSLMP